MLTYENIEIDSMSYYKIENDDYEDIHEPFTAYVFNLIGILYYQINITLFH